MTDINKQADDRIWEKRNICGVCGKPYVSSYQVGVNITTGKKWCIHDDIDPMPHFDNWDRRIINNLKPGEVLAKGSDGISRICNVIPKKEIERREYYDKHRKR